MQKQEHAGKEGGETGGAPLRQKRAREANPTPQPSSAWGSCPRAEGAWAESIMRRPGQGSPGQSNALGDQRSTCWVVGWEGLGRKRLDWSGGPPGRGQGRDTEGMRGERGTDMGFRNNQNAHEQPALLGVPAN